MKLLKACKALLCLLMTLNFGKCIRYPIVTDQSCLVLVLSAYTCYSSCESHLYFWLKCQQQDK